MSEAAARPSGGLTRALVWAVAHAVNDGYPTLYLALLPLLMSRWHFSLGQAGLLAGLSALTTQALQPLLGSWSDRLGGPWFIVGGLAAGSVGSALGLAWSPSYAVFAGTLMLAGLGNAAFHPHMAALVRQSAPGREGRQTGIWMVSGMIGHALAPLAAVAALRWGGQLGVAALALPGLAAAALLLGSARAVPRRPRRPDPSTSPWAAAWTRGRAFFLMVVLRNLGTASLLTLLPILWHDRGGGLSATGALLTVVYGAGTVGNLLGGALSDRLGSRVVLAGSLALATVSAAGWALAHGGLVFWVLVALWGFSVNGAGAVMLVYGQGLFPGREGMASGLTLGWGNTVGALGAWGVGELAQSRGVPVAMMAAAVCLAAAIGPALRVMGRSRGPDGLVPPAG